MRALHWACVAACLLTVGCAGKAGMVKSEGSPAVRSDQATIVFMRSSFVGSAIAASVHDVTGAEAKVVGIVNDGTKVAYNVPAGEHWFMVVSEAADFMRVNVLAGKTYYAMVTPRMGAWKARFSFKPLRQSDLGSSEFTRWYEGTSWVTPSAETYTWAQENAADIQSKRERYWPEWNGKELYQRESQTLNANDGK